MNYLFELRASRDIQVTAGGYWETEVMTNGITADGNKIREEYPVDSILSAGQLIAGFGRQNTPMPDIHSLTFCIATNIILDPGLLAYSLTLVISQQGHARQEIPLSSPCIQVAWPKRGIFEVSIRRQ